MTEVNIIMNSSYIHYLNDHANENIPKLMCDLNRCIALFVASPSNVSYKQLSNAYQNIT